MATIPEPPRQTPLLVSYPDGDIILRASDGYVFRVHRSVLAKRSQVFRDRFSIPKWQDEDTAKETPVVSLDEDSDYINNMLKLVYHISETPDLSSTPHVNTLLDACDKYHLPTDTVISVSLLTDENPLRAWAIATRHGLEDIKQKSIIRAIQMDDDAFFKDPPAEFASIDGVQGFGLTVLRNRAISSARRKLTGMGWPCTGCRGHVLKNAYLQRTETMNPFCPEATSKLMFELCVALHGCGDKCKVALNRFNDDEFNGVNRFTLRAGLDQILQKASHGQLVDPVPFKITF